MDWAFMDNFWQHTEIKHTSVQEKTKPDINVTKCNIQ
jgi:hypothetical protein